MVPTHEVLALRGIRITLVINIAAIVFQTAIMATLARLVTAADYGLLAGALMLMRVVQHLIVAGPERALLLLPEPDPATLSVVFRAFVTVGLAVSILLAAGSGLALWLGLAPSFALTLAALSPLLPLTTAGIVFRAVLRRRLAFGRLTLADTAGQLVGGGAVAFVAASAGWGVFALVLGQLAASLLQTVLIAGFALRSGHVRILKSPPSWRPLLAPIITTSLAIGRTSLLEVLHGQIPLTTIGLLLGEVSLGMCNRAVALVQVPLELLVSAVTRVRISTITAHRDDGTALRAACRDLMSVSGAIILPLSAGMAAAATPLTVTVLGSEWRAAGVAIAWTAVAAGAGQLGHVVAVINEGMLRFDDRFRIQLATTVIAVAGMVLGGWTAELSGALAGWAAGCGVFLALHLLVAAQALSLPLAALCGTLLPGAAAAAGCVVAISAVSALLPGFSAPMRLLADILLCATVTTGLYAFCFTSLFTLLLRHAGVRRPMVRDDCPADGAAAPDTAPPPLVR